MEKVAIVIPAHNEERRIGSTLKNYLSFFRNLKKKKILNFEIIVVLNGCNDGTKKVVQKCKAKELRILDFKRAGKGFAIIEGFKYALKKDFSLIGFVDADEATPPIAFYDLVKNIGGYDGVIANRWDKRSVIKLKQTFSRRFLSRALNLIVRSLFLFPYKDTQCGAKLFKRRVLEKCLDKMISTKWVFDIALIFYLRKYCEAKIKSIPTIWKDKKESKLNLKKTPFTMFLSVIKLRLVNSPFRFLVRPLEIFIIKIFHDIL